MGLNWKSYFETVIMATLTPCSHVPCQNLCTVCDGQVARIGSGTWPQCWTLHSACSHASFSHVSLQDSKRWLVNHNDIRAGWSAHLHTWKHVTLVSDTVLENNQVSCFSEDYILLGCDTVSPGEVCLMFRDYVLFKCQAQVTHRHSVTS